MPIYEYLCSACEHELEVLQKISEEPLVFCPECGEKTLKKQISKAAFRLKGSGWYETDFKDSGKKKAADVKESGNDAAKDSKMDSSKDKAADSGDTKASGSKDTSSKSSGDSKASSASSAA
jgi:putative FmdB family regulatory protein